MRPGVAGVDDGTPPSASPTTFLQLCALPAAWRGQAQWRVLATGFDQGQAFLAAWQAWRDDPARPRVLHFVALLPRPPAADALQRAAAGDLRREPLAAALAAQWWGLLPGVHRLTFEGGQVLLTLAIGGPEALLRQLAFQADQLWLAGLPLQDAGAPTGIAKGLARLSRRGTRIAAATPATVGWRDAFRSCGFVLQEASGDAPLQGGYAPHWRAPREEAIAVQRAPGDCVVMGAGLAGAAVAASLARRGWQVRVLDAAPGPAEGASGLPAGLLAPQQSPDDNPLSRLSRSGVRMTLQQLHALLPPGQDWEPSGVLEWRADDTRLPPPLGPGLAPWTRVASEAQLREAGLPTGTHAWWHERAGWARPGALVRAWLTQPGISFQGGRAVARLQRAGADWLLLDAGDRLLAQAPLVVVATAHASAQLLSPALQQAAGNGDEPARKDALQLNGVRGQLAWQRHSPGLPLPPWPLNGHGHLVPRLPLAEGRAWLSGATYGRGDTDTSLRLADQEANLARLRQLQPELAAALAPLFDAGDVQAWAGVRCTSFDRRPLVGEWAPGLWVSTALGSRGLTFAALCGELLAARLHGEPLPLEQRLADLLDVARQRGG